LPTSESSTRKTGIGAALNAGTEAAFQGNFIAFVDADDMIEPAFFAYALDVLQRYPNVSLVYSWVRYFGLESIIWPTWNAEFPYLLGHNMLTPLVVLRRSAFLQWARNTPTMEYSLEDYEGWVGLVEAGGLGVSLARPLVRYRVRAGSMYRSANRNQMLYLYDVIAASSRGVSGVGVELFNLQNTNGAASLLIIPPLERWNAPRLRGGLEQQRERLWSEVQRWDRQPDGSGAIHRRQRTYIEI
jgi:glycosyltransferase involved in cell wall biosynthesis